MSIYLVDWWNGQNTSESTLMKHLRSSDTPKNVRNSGGEKKNCTWPEIFP